MKRQTTRIIAIAGLALIIIFLAALAIKSGRDETSVSADEITCSDWAKEYVTSAAKSKLLPDGFKNTDLTKLVTRAEYSALCVKLYEALSGSKAQSAPADSFTDTDDEGVLKAYKIGIVSGAGELSDGSYYFDPFDTMTRESAAIMLVRAYKAAFWDGWTLDGDSAYTQKTLDTSGVVPFEDDSQMSDYSRPSVYFLVKNGVIEGLSDTVFAPNPNSVLLEGIVNYGKLTREEAVKMMVLALKELDGKE